MLFIVAASLLALACASDLQDTCAAGQQCEQDDAGMLQKTSFMSEAKRHQHLNHMPFDDFGLDPATWLGFEDPEDIKSNAKNIAGLVASSASSAPDSLALNSIAAPPPTVLVLGLFNTGTNLLTKILRKNFPVFDHVGVGGEPLGLSVWKHLKPDMLKEKLARRGQPNILRSNGVVAIAVVRDPLSWIQSMRKVAYDLEGCMRTSAWDVRGCTFPRGRCPSNPPYETLCVERPFHIDNIESVWNQWNKQYHELEEMGFAPNKTVVVSYEELLLDAHGMLERIATATGQPIPKNVQDVVEPAKWHGNPNGREAALKKLTSKSYMHRYTRQQRLNVCQRLSQPLMHLLGYHDCDGWVRFGAQGPA